VLRYDDTARALAIGVRELVQAIAPTGDLFPGAAGPGWAGTLSARARIGRVAHVAWQEGRLAEDESYRREIPITVSLDVLGWTCTVSGRMDGLVEVDGAFRVEEFKTTLRRQDELASLDDTPPREAAIQLRTYLYLAERSGCRPVEGRLVLSSAIDGSSRTFRIESEPAAAAVVESTLSRLVELREERIGRLCRRRSIPVPFAHDAFRPGQAGISERVFDAARKGHHLLLQAPPGLGKTAAVLHGVLRSAFASDASVFFATARNTQQLLAEETLARVAARGLPLTSVTLRARSRYCTQREMACGPATCPSCVGYYDRVRENDVHKRLLERGTLGAEALLDFGARFRLCPYQLSQELASRVDVVIGDYNYAFDPDTTPLRLFEEPKTSWMIVVDEAHNLPDRARSWWSPSLAARRAEATSDALRDGGPAFEPFAALCDTLASRIRSAGASGMRLEAAGETDLVRIEPDNLSFHDLRDRADELAPEYLRLAHAFGRHPLLLPGDPSGSDAWQQLTWSIARFDKQLAAIGPETVVLHRGEDPVFGPAPTPESWGLYLFCRDPSPFLRPRFATLATAVLMSATLEPSEFYRDLLGLELERSFVFRADGFFDPDALLVVVAPGVSTALRDRGRDRSLTIALVEQVVTAIPGNCAVLFSSFALRDSIATGLALPGRHRLLQTPEMPDRDRNTLLDELKQGKRGEPSVLLGVLGGIFSEGVDLPGNALLGVVLVGPALPAVTVEQELLREWYQSRWEDGFRLAYLVCGMTRVVQAAGRVLRTQADRGVVVLVDRRFVQNDYRAFFPPTWKPLRSARPWEPIRDFFQRAASEGSDPEAGGERKEPQT
jgi:DNA excision repair protein ERCC-2